MERDSKSVLTTWYPLSVLPVTAAVWSEGCESLQKWLLREAEIPSPELGHFPLCWHWVKTWHTVPQCVLCHTTVPQQIAGLRPTLMGESLLLLGGVTATGVVCVYQALHLSVDPVSFNYSIHLPFQLLLYHSILLGGTC